MDLFTLTGVGWRPKLGSLLMALVGLSPLAVPARSEAADTCGRVYVVNADNELLRLRRSAELLARDGADERDRNAEGAGDLQDEREDRFRRRRTVQWDDRFPIHG